MKPIGIIAGDGRLPVAFAQAATSKGKTVVGIGVVPAIDPEMESVVDRFYRIPVTHWGSIIECLMSEGVTDLYLLGKVNKQIMFTQTDFDESFQRLLAGLTEKNDDAVVLAFVKDLADHGITVRDQTELIRDLMPGEGAVTKRELTTIEMDDVRYGMKIAKEISRLDIGQTVVVKSGAVLAVEAIEGTDAAIVRGGKLGVRGAIVAKVAKPNQDSRFDVPTVGVNTIQSMINGKASILAIDAEKTFLVDKVQVVSMAEEAGIAIIAVKYP